MARVPFLKMTLISGSLISIGKARSSDYSSRECPKSIALADNKIQEYNHITAETTTNNGKGTANAINK